MSILHRFSVRQALRGLVALVAVLMVMWATATVSAERARQALAQAQETRITALALAAEFRQGVDDLAQLARSYVVTGEPRLLEQHQALLDIRDGQRARPQQYGRVYWDLVGADGQPPRPDSTVAVSLRKLMEQAGYSAAELVRLDEAWLMSDALASTERRAMQETQRDAAARGPAQQLLHGDGYQLHRTSILQAFDDMAGLLEQRTAREVALAQLLAQRLAWLSTLLAVAVVVILAVSLRLLYRGSAGPLAQATRMLVQLARGDLSDSAPLRARGQVAALLDALQRLRKAIVRLVKSVHAGAAAIQNAAGDMAAGTEHVVARTEEQAQALLQAAASMQQLAGTVQQHTAHTHQASRLARRACEVVRRSAAEVEQVASAMAAIKASSARITDLGGLIDSIAVQSKLLAASASLASGSHGAGGRTLSSVAQDVSALAQRTASAAAEVKSLTETALQQIQNGSRKAMLAEGAMREAVYSVERVSQLIGQIAEVNLEQTSGVDQVVQVLRQVQVLTQQNGLLLRQTTSAARALNEQTEQLAQAAAEFRLEAGYEDGRMVIDMPG
ncbi:methyl-accepting chemotaxis protein [Herbaspirillum seropedicae]|uniref:methyl-accepting chemotaxis protein n=1 Tax=Herbaspirillum seropedicae TaxID=964 RepID=UPI00112123A7|nr:methyl-accepting chemotaxis protein [Herbaspirillum seropedicae]QDD64846.1 methyl-accepting chemotaxis protein [Herbaspirillum seropedicae]